MSRTFWDAHALAALVAGDEAARYEAEDATLIAALVTSKVDTPALLRRAALADLPEAQRSAWDALVGVVHFVPVDDDLIAAALQLAEDLYLPSDHAWPLAAAFAASCDRVVSASEELLISAQMLGLRVSLVGGE